jgi:hypothetical protein
MAAPFVDSDAAAFPGLRTSTARLVGVGAVTGVLAGLLGVGGGIVIVPALIWMGFERHRANATSLAVILLTAVSGMLGFAAASALDVPVGLVLGAGGVAGATLGAVWAKRLSVTVLARIFGVLLLVTGIQMLVGGGQMAALTGLEAPWTLVISFVVGALTGIVSGLAGVGGGVIMVPALVLLLGFDQHTAEGTSLLAICFTAAAATRVNASHGYLQWKPVLLVAAGGVVLAPIAAVFAQRIPADTLGRIFALWLLVIGVRTLVGTRSPPA